MSKPKLHTIQSGYFPNALRALAEHAQYGNDKHNPGEPLHWAFNKSTEHAESAARHASQAGTIDPETGKSHTIGYAMRVMMLLEAEEIQRGARPGFAVRGLAPAEPEGGPDIYDPKTRQVIAHPAQKLAIKAWKDCLPVVDPDGHPVKPAHPAESAEPAKFVSERGWRPICS